MSERQDLTHVPNMRLMLIIGSVRPGRCGLPVTLWAYDMLMDCRGVDIDFVDLMETNLPFMNEPKPPKLKQYEYAHTREWSARVEDADAFIFVAPAYNEGFAPALRNAMDYLALEWQSKPFGIVSYGQGASEGGARLKESARSLGLVPARTTVAIRDSRSRVQDGEFFADDELVRSCSRMIEDIRRLHAELSPARSAGSRVAERVNG
ncbi:NAD(P)H-dependent FMN reductase [Paramicrobacterium humi]|uniref:NAD(P)H-dependent FMN reductase n=1 Tax=Paramicrobacterium humi TaxID=640635 RepID=A0A1H4P037_9MICO|nr:NAD(P)H-dependent oxidoreductase [Microbacterium humi]SEC00498.1 NAD(P)H-dependent FMN reductase [Microbacterium humi]